MLESHKQPLSHLVTLPFTWGACLLLLLLSRFSRVQLCVTGILQARTLEWVAISFSNA